MTSRTKSKGITKKRSATSIAEPLWLNLDARMKATEYEEPSPENYTWHQILQSNKPLPNRSTQNSTINEESIENEKEQAHDTNERPGRVFDAVKDYATKVEWKDLMRFQRAVDSSNVKIVITDDLTKNLAKNESVPNYSQLNSGKFEQNLALDAGNEQLSKKDNTFTNSQLSQYKQRSYDSQCPTTAKNALEEKKQHRIRTAQNKPTASQAKNSNNLKQNNTSTRTALRRQITPRTQKAQGKPPNVRPQTTAASPRTSYLKRITVQKTNRVSNKEQSRAEVPFSATETYDKSHLSRNDTLATVSCGMLDDHARRGQLLTANRHRQLSKEKKSITRKSDEPVDFTATCSPSAKQRSAINEGSSMLDQSCSEKSETLRDASMLPSSQQFATHDCSQTRHFGHTFRSGLNIKQKAAITASTAANHQYKQCEQQFLTEAPHAASTDVDKTMLLQKRNLFLDKIELASKRTYPTGDDVEQHYRLEHAIKHIDSRLLKSEHMHTQRNMEPYFLQTKVKNNIASQSLHYLLSEAATSTRNIIAKSTANHVTWCDQAESKALLKVNMCVEMPKNSAYDNDNPSATSASSSFLDLEDILRSQIIEIPARPNYLDLEDVLRSQTVNIPTRPTTITETANECMNAYLRALMTALFQHDSETATDLDSISLDSLSASELELPAFTNCLSLLPIYIVLANKFANIRY